MGHLGWDEEGRTWGSCLPLATRKPINQLLPLAVTSEPENYYTRQLSFHQLKRVFPIFVHLFINWIYIYTNLLIYKAYLCIKYILTKDEIKLNTNNTSFKVFSLYLWRYAPPHLGTTFLYYGGKQEKHCYHFQSSAWVLLPRYMPTLSITTKFCRLHRASCYQKSSCLLMYLLVYFLFPPH